MVEHRLVNGNKAPGDVVDLIKAEWEPLTVSDVLFWLSKAFPSEDCCYPRSKGCDGSNMLLKAIIMVHRGVSVEDVCRKFNLEFKVRVR